MSKSHLSRDERERTHRKTSKHHRSKHSCSTKDDRQFVFKTVDVDEVTRLLTSLVQKNSAIVTEILDVFSALDSGSQVSLQGIINTQVRKKMRHLLTALDIPLHVDTSNHPPTKTYKAPRFYRKHLKLYIKGILKSIAVSLHMSWDSLKVRTSLPQGAPITTLETEPSDATSVKPLSLMEAYQRGHYGKHDDSSSRYIQKEKDLWGKPQAEQRITECKDYSDGQPWRRFDRDRDVLHASRITKVQFDQCFRDPQFQLGSRFKEST